MLPCFILYVEWMNKFSSIIDELSEEIEKKEVAEEVFDSALLSNYEDSLASPAYQLQRDFTDQEYFSVPGYSSSLIKMYIENPDLYINNNTEGLAKYEIKQTKSKKIGSVLHRIILENYKPSQFSSILSPRDFEIVTTIKKKVQENEYLMNILKGTEHFEKAIFWKEQINDKLLQCKAKVDLVTKNGCLFELKTAKNLKEEDIRKQIDNYRYDLQLSFYTRGWEKIHNTKLKIVGIIGIETEPPFGTHVFQLTPRFLERGRHGGVNTFKQSIAGWENVLEEMHFNPQGRFNNYYTILDV